MRRGTPGSSPAPNSASGRLLPVEVNPGIRESLTVFPDLDGHRPQQFRLPLVQRHAVHDLAHGAHDLLAVARLEEFHPRERPLDILEETLQLLHRRRGSLPPRRLERALFSAAGPPPP